MPRLPLALILALTLTVSACGPSQSDVDALNARIVELEAQLDEAQNGPERRILAIRDAFEKGEFAAVIAGAQELAERHPGLPATQEAEGLAERAREELDRARAEAEAAAAAALAEERRAREQALASMRADEDEVGGVTWYRHRNAPRYLNSRDFIGAYFSRTGTGLGPLRLDIRYVADDWLFIESFIVLADGQRFTVTPGYSGMERDNGGGGIWEWYDQPASTQDIQMLEAIANSEEATLRYDGQQYRDDRTITSAEKQAIRETLAAYRALQAGGPNP